LAQGNNSCRSGSSCLSRIPVIQALLSFQRLPVVLAIRRPLRSLKIKEIKKGKSSEQFAEHCFLLKKSPKKLQ
jgi:hypothetical protein